LFARFRPTVVLPVPPGEREPEAERK